MKQLFINIQRKGDIVDLLIFVNLVSASVHLVASESLNESMVLFISFGYVGVKEELITPVGSVAFVSVSTSGMVSAIFPYVGKVCIEIFRNSSRISYHVTCFGVELVNVNLFKGFKFTNSLTIFHVLPLSLLFSIINSLLYILRLVSIEQRKLEDNQGLVHGSLTWAISPTEGQF